MRRRSIVAAVTLAVAAAGGGTAYAVTRSGGDQPQDGPRLPAATAPVQRGDLTDTRTVDGTLGYGDTWNLVNGASGTVTWARGAGAVVRRGGTLYRVGNEPVVLMYGDLPVYRTLSAGVSDGPDVEELERNLAKLGYGDGMTVDEHFSGATTDAVADWQDDHGLPETGVVDAAQIVFAPSAVRTATIALARGEPAAPGKPAMTVTGVGKQVRIDLDTADQDLARRGAKATVELPNGATTPGRVDSVGKVAKQASGGSTEGTTVEVDVRLTRPEQADRYDEAPVSVDLASGRAENVLSVPVQALLARPEGGYAVQVVRGRSVRTISVTTGVYAQTQVEVTGPGLAAGMRVGVPAP
jgi:peptidoglycan hydrolase-like protein with peptidoglycan-binding domain